MYFFVLSFLLFTNKQYHDPSILHPPQQIQLPLDLLHHPDNPPPQPPHHHLNHQLRHFVQQVHCIAFYRHWAETPLSLNEYDLCKCKQSRVDFRIWKLAYTYSCTVNSREWMVTVIWILLSWTKKKYFISNLRSNILFKSSIFNVYACSISVGGRLYLRLHFTIRPSHPEHIAILYEHELRLISEDGDDEVNGK